MIILKIQKQLVLEVNWKKNVTFTMYHCWERSSHDNFLRRLYALLLENKQFAFKCCDKWKLFILGFLRNWKLSSLYIYFQFTSRSTVWNMEIGTLRFLCRKPSRNEWLLSLLMAFWLQFFPTIFLFIFDFIKVKMYYFSNTLFL